MDLPTAGIARAVRALWSRGAFPYSRRYLAGSLSGMWAAGGVMAIASVALPHPPEVRTGVATALGVGGLVMCAFTWATRNLLPGWVYPALVSVAMVVVTLAVIAGGGGVASTAYSFLYLWVIVYSQMFFTPRVTAAVVVLGLLGFGAARLVLGSFQPVEAVMLVGTTGVTAMVVGGLARAREASEVDPLTETTSRVGLDRHLTVEMARAEQEDLPLTVAIIGIDGFSGINDQHGHDAGDRILRMLAESWRAELRAVDVLGRLGGDQFVVLLPGCPIHESHAVIERMRAQVPLGVTCSAGLTAWHPGDSVSMILSRADTALYEAKRQGRDRTIVSGEDTAAIQELTRAIEGDELVVHYQPTVCLETGRIMGLEALVRWQHPDRGLVPPVEFIPLAEASGLVIPMGAWVLEEACRLGRVLFEAFPDRPLTMAVNVSGHQLDDPGMVDMVRLVLAVTGLPPSQLTLEITESVLAENLSRWSDRLKELLALGVELAMDDFGTGYSSLNQLRKLPVGTVKVDRSFIEDLADCPEAGAVVAAMVGLGQGLGRRLLAEGVETVAQLDALYHHGFDAVQGFLLGRPVPGEVIHRLLEDLEPSRSAHQDPRSRVDQLISHSADLHAAA